MAGKGPPPKRSEQRRRTNTPAAGEPTKAPGARKVAKPRPDPKWHPVARRWFNSLALSGQAQFYEPSDWGAAYLLAETMSRELMPQPITLGRGETAETVLQPIAVKSASIAAWLKGMTALLATEGDRRHAALELQRAEPETPAATPAPVTDLRAWRESLGG